MASSPRTKIRMAWKRMEREGVSSPVIGYSIIWRGVLSGSGLAAVSSASVQCHVCSLHRIAAYW
jgi:hypothetical protein